MENQTIWNNNQINTKEYYEHEVFSSLREFTDFYHTFSSSIMRFSKIGTKSIINIDTYVYSSIEGTLESVSTVLKNGRIGDAFSLLRKYHDSVTMNIYTNLYLEDNRNREKFIVKEITDWMGGKNKLPHNQYRTMSEYIEKSEKLKPVTDLIYKNGSYKETRKRCNDHTHYNCFSNVMVNDNQVHLDNRLDLLTLFKQDVTNIFILHLAYIFFLNDYYMISSDYLDSLEMGMEPEDNSQYWVAPFVQDIFSEIIVNERPDLAQLIYISSDMI